MKTEPLTLSLSIVSVTRGWGTVLMSRRPSSSGEKKQASKKLVV